MTESGKVVSISNHSNIGAEASEWVIIMSEEDVSASNLADFSRWIGQSEKHRQLFRDRAALWGGLDELTKLNDYAASDDVQKCISEDQKMKRRHVYTKRAIFSAAAAAALIFAISPNLSFNQAPQQPVQETLLFQTDLGEQKNILLSDGSNVNLNSDTEITASFGPKGRIVELVRGEAHFEVEPDANRPFSVVAGETSVVAIGTAFTVYKKNNKIDVTVTHGRVALFDEITKAKSLNSLLKKPPMARVSAGQTVVHGENIELLANIEPAAISKKLSWRDGMLAFSGDPLSKVVSDLGRYTGTTIEIEDSKIASLPISGYVKIGNNEDMFEAIEIMAGLTVVKRSPTRILLVKTQ